MPFFAFFLESLTERDLGKTQRRKDAETQRGKKSGIIFLTFNRVSLRAITQQSLSRGKDVGNSQDRPPQRECKGKRSNDMKDEENACVLDKKIYSPRHSKPCLLKLGLFLCVSASLRFFLKVLRKETWEKRKDAKTRRRKGKNREFPKNFGGLVFCPVQRENAKTHRFEVPIKNFLY
jgi:hypothetical protein